MTYEEAIKVIESNRPTAGYTMLCEALDIAKEALEKQMPKKPIRAFQSGFFWCADCERAIKMRINHSKINIRYCPFCGQALDWSDTE